MYLYISHIHVSCMIHEQMLGTTDSMCSLGNDSFRHFLCLRFMFGLGGVPSLIMFFGFFFMPESPRWLVFHGREDKARKVLMKLRRPGRVEKELRAIVRDYEDHSRNKLGECVGRVHVWVCVLVWKPRKSADMRQCLPIVAAVPWYLMTAQLMLHTHQDRNSENPLTIFCYFYNSILLIV